MNKNSMLKLVIAFMICLMVCLNTQDSRVGKGSVAEAIDRGHRDMASGMKGKKAALFPDAVPMKFYLSDGSDDWLTTLVVKNREGSFRGTYSTDRKGKKVRISRFNGRFGQIRKINSYTYRMTLEKLSLKKQPGEEWVDQGTQYVACEPPGLKTGRIYTLYASEMPMKKFYRAFSKNKLKNWFPDYRAKKKPKGLLSRFVLTGSGMEGAFITGRVLMKKDIRRYKQGKHKTQKKFFFTQSGEKWGTWISMPGKKGSFHGIYNGHKRKKRNKASGCKFSGRFGNIKKLNPYTYTMTVKELETARYAGGRNSKSLPYGLKKGEKFVLYMPNTPMDVIRKKFKSYLSWIPYYDIPKNMSSGRLSCYGLYNKNMGYGWWL